MRAKQTIETLEKLIDEILSTEGTERTILCMTIDSILDRFEDWSKNSQDAQDMHPCPGAVPSFITRMKGPLYTLAGLNDYFSDPEQCVAWLREGILGMKNVNALKL